MAPSRPPPKSTLQTLAIEREASNQNLEKRLRSHSLIQWRKSLSCASHVLNISIKDLDHLLNLLGIYNSRGYALYATWACGGNIHEIDGRVRGSSGSSGREIGSGKTLPIRKRRRLVGHGNSVGDDGGGGLMFVMNEFVEKLSVDVKGVIKKVWGNRLVFGDGGGLGEFGNWLKEFGWWNVVIFGGRPEDKGFWLELKQGPKAVFCYLAQHAVIIENDERSLVKEGYERIEREIREKEVREREADEMQDAARQVRERDETDKEVNHLQEQVAPQQEQVAPQQEQVAPRQEQIAPRQEQIAPRQEPIAPRQEPIAPRQKPIAPRQEPIAPRQEQITPNHMQVIPRKDVIVMAPRPMVPRPLAPRKEVLPNGEAISGDKESKGGQEVVGVKLAPRKARRDSIPRVSGSDGAGTKRAQNAGALTAPKKRVRVSRTSASVLEFSDTGGTSSSSSSSSSGSEYVASLSDRPLAVKSGSARRDPLKYEPFEKRVQSVKAKVNGSIQRFLCNTYLGSAITEIVSPWKEGVDYKIKITPSEDDQKLGYVIYVTCKCGKDLNVYTKPSVTFGSPLVNPNHFKEHLFNKSIGGVRKEVSRCALVNTELTKKRSSSNNSNAATKQVSTSSTMSIVEQKVNIARKTAKTEPETGSSSFADLFGTDLDE